MPEQLFSIGPNPFKLIYTLFTAFGVPTVGDVVIARRRTLSNSEGYPFCGHCYDPDRPGQFLADCEYCLGTGIVDPPLLEDGTPDFDASPVSWNFSLGGREYPVIAMAETNPDREIANFGGYFPGYDKLILMPDYVFSENSGEITRLEVQTGDRAKVWNKWYYITGIAKFNPQTEILRVAKLGTVWKDGFREM